MNAEAGILGASERKLVLDPGTRQVDGQQARFGAVNELEGA